MSAPAPRGTDVLVTAGTASYALGLPLGTAVVAIGTGLLAIAFLLRIDEARDMRPWRVPVMAIGLMLFAFIAARTLMADASIAGLHRINQYQELLLAPMLLVLWRRVLLCRLFFAVFFV